MPEVRPQEAVTESSESSRLFRAGAESKVSGSIKGRSSSSKAAARAPGTASQTPLFIEVPGETETLYSNVHEALLACSLSRPKARGLSLPTCYYK